MEVQEHIIFIPIMETTNNIGISRVMVLNLATSSHIFSISSIDQHNSFHSFKSKPISFSF